MRKTVYTLLVVALLALMIAPAAFAAGPVSGCAPGFELHDFMHHEDGEHMHRHIGLKVDLNGNGLICVKHLANGLHVHVDDVIP